MLKRPLASECMHAMWDRLSAICRSFVKTSPCISGRAYCPQGPELWGDIARGSKSGVCYTLFIVICSWKNSEAWLIDWMVMTLLDLCVHWEDDFLRYFFSGNERADCRLFKDQSIREFFALPFLLRFSLWIWGDWGHYLSEQSPKELLRETNGLVEKPIPWRRTNFFFHEPPEIRDQERKFLKRGKM